MVLRPIKSNVRPGLLQLPLFSIYPYSKPQPFPGLHIVTTLLKKRPTDKIMHAAIGKVDRACLSDSKARCPTYILYTVCASLPAAVENDDPIVHTQIAQSGALKVRILLFPRIHSHPPYPTMMSCTRMALSITSSPSYHPRPPGISCSRI